MKIRHGFVSNSSSASFILALSDEKECEHCGHSNRKMLDLIISMFSKGTPIGDFLSSFMGDPNHHISTIKEEISDLNKDIAWTLKKIEKLKALSKNSDAVLLFEEWNDIDHGTRSRWQREMEDHRQSVDDKLITRIRQLGESVEKAKNNIVKLEKKKAKLEEVADSGRVVYSFEIDYHDRLYSVVKDIVNSGYVDVIEQIMT
ncbi:MAG: hypothetical protein ACXAC5_04190 [Promethearchaeota archaeon]|jgi:hypothetical protein